MQKGIANLVRISFVPKDLKGLSERKLLDVAGFMLGIAGDKVGRKLKYASALNPSTKDSDR